MIKKDIKQTGRRSVKRRQGERAKDHLSGKKELKGSLRSCGKRKGRKDSKASTKRKKRRRGFMEIKERRQQEGGGRVQLWDFGQSAALESVWRNV